MLRRLVVFAGFLALASPAHAFTTYQVNSTDEAHDTAAGDGFCKTVVPGTCTLRAAVEEANVTGGIIGVPAGTYVLTLGALVVTHDVTVQGAGMNATVLSGQTFHRIFEVTPASGVVTLTVTDMTLRDGKKTNGHGGAVFSGNQQKVTLRRCLLTANEAAAGGAVSCNGLVTIEQCVLTGNHSTGAGGAIEAPNALDMKDSTVWGNTADTDGGGIAIPEGLAVISNSTIGGNTATRDGGGIHVQSTNTLAVNLRVYNVTIARNRAKHFCGGLLEACTVTPYVANSILASNLSGADGGFLIVSDCGGTFETSGKVILTSSFGCATDANAVVANPLLGPLQDNGGLAPTYALLDGSPAIDGAPVVGCFSASGELTTDERGVRRPLGASCDVGAYEKAPCGDASGDGTVNVSDVFFLVNYLFAGGPLPPGLANVNGDSALNVSDVFALVNDLFAGGSVTCAGT